MKGDLFGVLVQLTEGEAKTIVKGVIDKGFNNDGFKALIDLSHRCDARSEASVLRTFLEPVNPPALKMPDVVNGIRKWEGKVASLKIQCSEEMSDNIKHALLIGMGPKELQELIWQNGSTSGVGMKY